MIIYEAVLQPGETVDMAKERILAKHEGAAGITFTVRVYNGETTVTGYTE